MAPTVIAVDSVRPNPSVSLSIPALRMIEGMEPASAPMAAPKEANTTVIASRGETEDAETALAGT